MLLPANPYQPSAATRGMEHQMNTPFLLLAQYSGMAIIPLSAFVLTTSAT